MAFALSVPMWRCRRSVMFAIVWVCLGFHWRRRDGCLPSIAFVRPSFERAYHILSLLLRHRSTNCPLSLVNFVFQPWSSQWIRRGRAVCGCCRIFHAQIWRALLPSPKATPYRVLSV